MDYGVSLMWKDIMFPDFATYSLTEIRIDSTYFPHIIVFK